MGQAPYEALEEAMALAFPEDFRTQNSGRVFVPGRRIRPGRAVKTVENGGASWITPEFQRVFGTLPEEFAVRGRLVSPANVDGLFENLMISEGQVYGIDYEWVFDFPIPAKFLHYRNLLYFYRRYERMLSAGQEELFGHFGISKEEQAVFASMEEHFQSYVHDGGL